MEGLLYVIFILLGQLGNCNLSKKISEFGVLKLFVYQEVIHDKIGNVLSKSDISHHRTACYNIIQINIPLTSFLTQAGQDILITQWSIE